MPDVITSTPDNAPRPMGPYRHIARVGNFLTIGGVAGVDSNTGELVGKDVGAQTREILKNMSALLESANSDLELVIHVNVFLLRMSDFEEIATIRLDWIFDMGMVQLTRELQAQ